jgi:hypothetical protein
VGLDVVDLACWRWGLNTLVFCGNMDSKTWADDRQNHFYFPLKRMLDPIMDGVYMKQCKEPIHYEQLFTVQTRKQSHSLDL